MARLVGLHQPIDDLAGLPQHHLLTQLLGQRGVEPGHAADKARVQQRGQDFKILAGQGDALFQGAGRMSHIQPDVPQGIDDFLNQALRGIRHPFFEQDQQVHVGMHALVVAAIAAEGDNGVGVAGHVHARTDIAGLEACAKVLVHKPSHGMHEGRSRGSRQVADQTVAPLGKNLGGILF